MRAPGDCNAIEFDCKIAAAIVDALGVTNQCSAIVAQYLVRAKFRLLR